MADQEDRSFEPGDGSATRGREQGLGMGERELAAQRDPGGDRTADEEDHLASGRAQTSAKPDDLDASLAVQGLEETDGDGDDGDADQTDADRVGSDELNY